MVEVPGKEDIAWREMLGYGIWRPIERVVLNNVRFLHSPIS